MDKIEASTVRWLSIGDCVKENIGGGTPARVRGEYWGGDIPWASTGDLGVGGHFIRATRKSITERGLESSTSKLVKAGDLIIAIKVVPGRAKIAGVDLAINQDLRALSLKSFITAKYLVYYLETLNFASISRGAIVQSITKKALEGIRVPVLPLAVQHQIVVILDQFSDLGSKLTEELALRQQQYSYYRELMFHLSVEGLDGHPLCAQIRQCCPRGVECLAMGDLGKFFRGNGLQKKDMSESGFPCIHYGQIYSYYGTYAERAKAFVSVELAQRLRQASRGDLIIASTGENAEDVCKAVAWLGREKLAVSGDAMIYQHILQAKYAAYFFQTEQFRRQKRVYVTGAQVKRVSGRDLSKIRIPVPPMAIQERIAEILDYFDSLANDSMIGLPAEIAARRRQYRYYRNRLFSFTSPLEQMGN